VIGAQDSLKYHALRTACAPTEPLRDSIVGCDPGELQRGVIAEYLTADVFDAVDVGEKLLGLVGAPPGALVLIRRRAFKIRVRIAPLP
jgi:hypothetical protein